MDHDSVAALQCPRNLGSSLAGQEAAEVRIPLMLNSPYQVNRVPACKALVSAASSIESRVNNGHFKMEMLPSEA